MRSILVYAAVMFVLGMTLFRWLEQIVSPWVYLPVEFVLYLVVAVLTYVMLERKPKQ